MQAEAHSYLRNLGAARELAVCPCAYLALRPMHQVANDGQPFYLSDACGDLARRKQPFAALCQSDATLAQRASEHTARLEHHRELERYVYATSNEFKSSLRAMLNLANWIGEDTVDILPEPSKEHLAKLCRRIQRMEQMLDDLFAYASAESQCYSLERVDTWALVQEVVGWLAPPASFTVTIDRTLPIIAAERMPLAIVFRNLLENILRHRPQPPTGHVSISAHTTGAWLEFRAVDDGLGIDPVFYEWIVQLFQSLKSRDQRERISLGWLVIQKLVEGRGGAIDIEAKAGCGATFRFTWPKEPAPRVSGL